jgi:hypothetical protein
MSTLEADYIACSNGSHQVKWLPQLHQDIQSTETSPLPINCDNQSALCHITTEIITACTKHIDVCYRNSPDLHARMIVDYTYVHTNENLADIPTKPLTKVMQEKLKKPMGLW